MPKHYGIKARGTHIGERQETWGQFLSRIARELGERIIFRVRVILRMRWR